MVRMPTPVPARVVAAKSAGLRRVRWCRPSGSRTVMNAAVARSGRYGTDASSACDRYVGKRAQRHARQVSALLEPHPLAAQDFSC